MNFLKSLMRKHRLSAYKVYFVSIILFAIMYYLSDLYRVDILNYKPEYQYTYIDYLLFSFITATTVGAAGIKTISGKFDKGENILIADLENNKLFPFLSALAAPLSIKIVPCDLNELTIHFFLAAKADILGINFVKILFSTIYFIGFFLFPLPINM